MASVGASGAYYIACGTDRIVANPGTLTGSIGVIVQWPFYGELLEDDGLDQLFVGVPWILNQRGIGAGAKDDLAQNRIDLAQMGNAGSHFAQR